MVQPSRTGWQPNSYGEFATRVSASRGNDSPYRRAAPSGITCGRVGAAGITDERENEMDLSNFTDEEKSLLLFLETCVCDQWGIVDTRRMNTDDMEIAKKWNDEGFIWYRRLPAKYIIGAELNQGQTHRAVLPVKTLDIAYQIRKERSIRVTGKRSRRIKEFFNKLGGHDIFGQLETLNEAERTNRRNRLGAASNEEEA